MTNLVGGPFTRISFEEINLNSSQAIKSYLLDHGWQPDTWNYKKEGKREVYDEHGEKIKTSPKLTESSFHTVTGEIPSLIARRNILVHRQRMLRNTTKQGEEKGLLNSVREDGRIGAGAISCGTNTRRMQHRVITNIPSVGTVYGSEIRELFTVPEGYVLAGCDAKGLEARIQGHAVFPYKGGPELADFLINGDVHQFNAEMWGFPEDRKRAKAPLYCLMFGGQPAKLAATMGVSLREAEKHFDTFWKEYAPLASLKADLTKAWKSRGGKKGGFLRAIDGAKLWARSEHSLVNLYIQSTGSIAVKVATIFFDKWVKENNLRARQVLHFHDELQVECPEEEKFIVKELLEKAFISASKFLKLNVPLEGDVKFGRNWKDTH